jgi:CRP-like cAMP-binding protein
VHMDVKGRLADALLELSRLHKALYFTISRQDLAAFAGTTYETIYRNLQEFIAEKLITAEGRAITILNEKKLRRYIVGG